MNTRAILVLIAISASAAGAGDYWLTVANDPQSSCAQRKAAPGAVVAPADQVAADLARHFAGETRHLPAFDAALGNGHINFCGSSEREEVYHALVGAALARRVVNERHLSDYALMLGSQRLLAIIDERMAAGGISDTQAARLSRMRSSARKGLELRK